MLKYIIGIDLGTGSTKAVAINIQGKIIATAQHFYTTANPQPGYSEQCPADIWLAFLKCLNDTLQQLKTPPLAVSLSSAMHSVIPVDENGFALANAILWSDSRSAAIADDIRKSAGGEDIYRHTGTAIYAMSPLCKIIWMREHQSTLFNKAFKFTSIKEYIWFKLFSVFEIDYSIASATGLFDNITLKWYSKACILAGITDSKLSTPVDTCHTRLYTGNEQLLQLIKGQTRFVIGASDGCCANLSGNAINNGVAALTIGTSGAVRIGSSVPVYNYKAMTFNYLLNKNTFICGGAINNGGAVLDWLIKSFLKLPVITDDTYDDLFSSIQNVNAGSNGLIFLPYLYAERAPIWDAESSGVFFNINYRHQQQHFVRAAIEGICFALYDVLNAVEGSSMAVNEIVISGGFIASPVWVQILADVTGKKLILQQTDDSSAIGAVYLAMEALQLDMKKIHEDNIKGRVTILPDMNNHALYSKMFKVYQKLYSKMASSMHELNTLNG